MPSREHRRIAIYLHLAVCFRIAAALYNTILQFALYKRSAANVVLAVGALCTSKQIFDRRRSPPEAGSALHLGLAVDLLQRCAVLLEHLDYPGQKPPFWAVKRPACPYKTSTQNSFTMENAKGV